MPKILLIFDHNLGDGDITSTFVNAIFSLDLLNKLYSFEGDDDAHPVNRAILLTIIINFLMFFSSLGSREHI